jgi:hypothetical protein
MNRLFDRVFALCGLALLLAAVWMWQFAQAQDELPAPPPPCAGGNVLVTRHCTTEGDGQCTKETIVIRRVQPGEIIDIRGLHNPGRHLKAAFFTEQPAEEFPISVAGKFLRVGCACTAAGECHCANATCGEDCAGACKCCPCAAEAVVAAEAKCGDAVCGSDCEARTLAVHHAEHEDEDELAAEFHPLKLMRHIAGLVGEKAAAQAALAVRKDADDQLGELMETMAELLADNAALDAKLEAQNESHAEHRKLLEKVVDLATENARLKAHVELAAERVELARSSAALTLENERLKLRVVELEQKQALAEAARTAAKPKERKAR